MWDWGERGKEIKGLLGSLEKGSTFGGLVRLMTRYLLLCMSIQPRRVFFFFFF